MTPLKLFNILQSTKTKEEFITILRKHRPLDEYSCKNCNKRRRCT